MSAFHKLSARAKLMVAFIAVSAVMGLVACFALYQVSQVNTSLNELAERDVIGIQASYEANLLIGHMRRIVRDALLETETEKIAATKGEIAKTQATFEKEIEKLAPTLVTAEGKAALAEVRKATAGYFSGANQIIDLAAAGKHDEAIKTLGVVTVQGTGFSTSLRALCDSKVSIADKTAKAGEATYESALYLVSVAICGGVVLSLVLGWLIARWFTRALLEVSAIADSVASASQQLAAAAEELSSGAQEQASSLEETASSLEEITGTIQQNADNAQQANQLAGSSRDIAEKGGDVVARAVQGMGEINAASRKIADIITAIDEIAFQTNLLALNAAVEAARAGEQGRGFAVVAGEVRNLAQRAAAAAKEIKGLIQDSVSKVEAGSKLVNQSGDTLDEIVTSVKRVTDIVSEIAAASREQAGGIDQVNKAVTQMDQVTQGNASQTEELSGTAESLAAQAAQLQHLVAQFNLVRREARTSVSVATKSSHSVASRPAATRTAKPAGAKAKRSAGSDDTLERQVEHELEMIGTGSAGRGQGGFEEF